MNPEFQRHLWLEMQGHRLIAMPAVLILVFMAAWIGGGRESFPIVGDVTIGVLLIVWGSRLAADAVLGEVAARTWDAQRMSAVAPWDMAWGKLFGSTVYVWYGAAWCAIPYLFGHGTVLELIRLMVSGLQAQALALLISMLMMRRGIENVRFQVTFSQIVAVLVILPTHFLIPLVPSSYVSWYGLVINQPLFLIVSQMALLVWTILGIYRVMRAELQYRAGQPLWLGFVLYMVLYVAGFDFIMLASARANLPGVIMARLLVAFCTAIALTYFAAFVEPKNLVRIRQWINFAQTGKVGRMFALTPTWMLSMAIAILLAIITVIDLFVVAPPSMASQSSIAPFILALMLFCTRDIAMLYALVLSERPRRGHLTAVLYLILLYFVAPVALSAAKLDFLMPVLLPSPAGPPELVVLPVLAQAVLAVVVAMQRWRQIRVVELERAGMAT